MVGLLASAGIMGGLALMLANLTRQQHVTQKKAETGVEITALSNRVIAALYDGESCGNTIEGASPPASLGGGTSFAVDKLRGKGDTVAASRVLLEKGKVYGNRLVKIASMKLKVPSGNAVVNRQLESQFEVVFERVNKAFTGQKEVTKSFGLSLELDGSNGFEGCRSKFDSIALRVKKEICQEIGGLWNGSTGKCGNVVKKACEGVGGTGAWNGGNNRCNNMFAQVMANLNTKIIQNKNDIDTLETGKSDSTHSHITTCPTCPACPPQTICPPPTICPACPTCPTCPPQRICPSCPTCRQVCPPYWYRERVNGPCISY